MPIQKQSINLNFAQGLDQKMDPLQLRPGKFTSLKNRVFNKGGRLDKRNGYSALSKTVATPISSYSFSHIPGTLATGRNVTTYNNELLLNDGLGLYSFSQTNTNWVYKGRAELCSASSTSIYKDQYNNIAADSATNTTLGVSAYAWESWTGNPYKYDGTNVFGSTLRGCYLSVIDSVTGQTIYSGILSAVGTRPRCASLGGSLYVFYYDQQLGHLVARSVSQTTVGNEVLIASNIDPDNPNYDVVINNSVIYVAYNSTGTHIRISSYDSSLSNLHTFVQNSASGTYGVCIFPDTSNNIWCAYNNGTAIKALIVDTVLSSVLAETTLVNSAIISRNITGVYDTSLSKGVIFYDVPGVPILGQPFGYTAAASFTQPSNGLAVNVNLTGPGGSGNYSTFTQNNQIIYIPTGGYYWVHGAIPGSMTATLVNLAFTGNTTPGVTVAASSQIVYPTGGYQNAVTWFNTLTVGGVAGSAAQFVRSCALGSRAFLVNSAPHVTLAYDSLLQPTYFVGALYNTIANLPNAAIVAKLAESTGGGLPYRSVLPNMNVVSTGVLQGALLTKTFEILESSENTSLAAFNFGIFSGQIDFTTNNIQTNQLGNNLQIGSGTVLSYDGFSCVESNFHLFPETVTAVASGSDGGVGAGTYGYKICYAWVDNQGQTNRSAPSQNLSIDVAALNNIVLTIPTLRVTEKFGVFLEIYRTAVNGTIYYRLDTQYIPFPTNNSTTTDTVTFTDYTSDANIIGNAQLYTEQEVENIAPPAANILTEYQTRLIAVPSENPYEFWYSKQVVPGSPVEFNDAFVQNISTVGGAITGLVRLDDKLIIFKRASIFYMTGQGPSPNGTNNDFANPQFITADAGLTDLRSIVTTPVGIMFKSAKGIYMLDRSLQARYIGAAVEDFNSYTVVGSELIPTQNQVRFIISSGQALVYDYYWTDESGIGQWAVFDNISGVSSTIFQSLETFTTSAAQVYQESVGTYLDGATAVPTSFKTAWINVAGLQGFERAYYFYFLAKYISAHTLTINLYYDYVDTTNSANIAQTLTITPNATDLEQWRVFLSKQKCEAFLIEVIEGNSTGEGFNMSGLDIMVGIKKGYTTIKAAASAS